MRICIPLIMAAIATGCCACRTPVPDSATSAGSPQSYVISIGSGGGVTGLVGGIRIDTTGEVSRWQAMPSGESKSEAVGFMSEDQRRLLYAIIEEDDLTEFDHKVFGNMTAFVTLTGGGSTHSMQWEGSDATAEDAPMPLRRFIRAFNESYKLIEDTSRTDK